MNSIGFLSSAERVENEKVRRAELANRLLPFGVNYLDKALRGILPDDLIILGAMTGAGKTQLATTIALATASLKRKVYYFALEAAQDEIERRMKYAKLVQAYHAKEPRPIETNFLDWYLGKYDELFAQFETEIQSDESWQYLQTYYRSGDFGIKDLERLALAVSHDAGLIILDHIHYLDFDDRDTNRALSDATKKIRDLAQISNVPIIVVAHLRKQSDKDKSTIPSLSDFHGSSDLTKIGTKVILIAPGDQLEAGRSLTFFWAGKVRADGAANRYVGCVIYNSVTNRYEDRFDLMLRMTDGSLQKVNQKQIPGWLK